MKDLKYFKTKDFHSALRDFFKDLNVPVNYIAEEPARPQDILSQITFKEDREAFQLMDDVYFLGMVDDAAFEGGASLDYQKIESDYDGILIFGVILKNRNKDRPPTRSQLADITRAFNREFHYTPVVVVFRYAELLAFANAERLPYKQQWREGEKAGKVSLLRDIDPDNPHRGHLDILNKLAINRTGKQAVNSFTELYSYWQSVFNVSLLNKKFYEELSNWYFWAIKEVAFPGEPTAEDVTKETGKMYDPKRQEELRHEHNAKNVIRLLTRFLFVWFIKEKQLIPPKLFDQEFVKNELVNDLSPIHEEGLYASRNIKSYYYKAILQNLFFATLNCPIKSDNGDKRNRGFSKGNFGVLYLMRYENCFKNKELFVELVNNTVPFLNGGLFECLDIRGEKEKKEERIYIDGFSDNLPKEHKLIVPDYLFFGLDEKVDLSSVIGIYNKKTKEAAVKGLIRIFDSYKFTIAENTPIEEDIALDPELLGKVFENLLASYNPETRTTARKQTGSFYTPREIVNYMVDESLIAYLKNAVKDWGIKGKELDDKLHQLLSFNPGNPFAGNTIMEKKIIKSLDTCTILDPACGSGAFPMGILQKMVHVLQKLDPDNTHWRELQKEKALQETESVFHLTDKEARKLKLDEINEAFDEQINDSDYARKLFLIENCIYGVDIQPIAAQISKLRFLISLVVDQKVDENKPNFGIRPLPNLETKFVAANTLIGIEKSNKQGHLFTNKEIKELEEELKNVRHRILSAKTPKTKRTLREEDQALREKMGELLIADGWANKTARQLAAWDPYDQNSSSPFFDPEWMFGMKDGFDSIIGNPPYVGQSGNKELFRIIKNSPFGLKYHQRRMDYFYFFFHKSLNLIKQHGVISFITTNYFFNATYANKLREHIIEESQFLHLVDFNEVKIFESAQGQHNCISILEKSSKPTPCKVIFCRKAEIRNETELNDVLTYQDDNTYYNTVPSNTIINSSGLIDIKSKLVAGVNTIETPLEMLTNFPNKISDFFNFNQGVVTGGNKISQKHLNKFNIMASVGDGIFVISESELSHLGLNDTEKKYIKPWYKNSDVCRYVPKLKNDEFLIYYTSFNLCEFHKIQNLIKHFSPYKELLINRNIRTGSISVNDYENFVQGRKDVDYVMIKSTFQQGQYFCVSYARNQEIFESPKIICPQRSYKNTFAYTKKSWYGASDLYYINHPDNNTDELKTLLGILNSRLIYSWLYYKGQRKGEMLQLFKDPLNKIPIIDFSSDFNKELIVTLVDIIIYLVTKNISESIFQMVLDGCVFSLYFKIHMKEKQIDILQFVKIDLAEVIMGRNFEQLPDSEKENVINQLHAHWTHPDSEVRNRIKLFAVRSPDILKPILESR